MTVDDVAQAFAQFEDGELSLFERVEKPLSKRPDLCAFLLLDQLLPGKASDIVCSADHDQIWLDVNMEAFAAVATEEHIITFLRCGVWYDTTNDTLSMYA